jgi:hypothetical protein
MMAEKETRMMAEKETRVPYPAGMSIVLPHDPTMQNRLMLFHNSSFLAQPGEDYQFDSLGDAISFAFDVKDGAVLTLIDPQDGRRWKMVYPGEWEKLV